MDRPEQGRGFTRLAEATPPQAWFAVSAVFHYLGPSFAVLLFPAVGVLGIAWFRIASAAVVFSLFSDPLGTIRRASPAGRRLLIGLGACFAAMNTAFYLALESLPMSLVAAMEFVGTIGVALYGLRTARNGVALMFAVAGIFILIDVEWASDARGLAWAVANAAFFVAYIVLGHRAARHGASGGVAQLGAAMVIAAVLLTPIAIQEASRSFGMPLLVLAGVGVGLSSSVIPYICDQLAMSRLPRASFALMLALLPATATLVAAIVLAQIPTLRDLAGIALVMTGIAVHKPAQS